MSYRNRSIIFGIIMGIIMSSSHSTSLAEFIFVFIPTSLTGGTVYYWYGIKFNGRNS